jgi:hypothetical protein
MAVVPPPEPADLARLADGDESPERVLHRIVRYATTLVPGCTAACLTVRSPEGHETAAVSDDRVRDCHAAQFAPTGNGPGREALRWSEPRRADDLDHEERSPEFAGTSVRSGFRSCVALPLRSDRHGVSSEDAFLLLQQESQRSHRKVREVAQALLEQHRPGGAGPEAPWTPPRRTARFPLKRTPRSRRLRTRLSGQPVIAVCAKDSAVLTRSSLPEPELAVAALVDRLRRRGLDAVLAASECCGERDLRICVRRRSGPTVELLCCTAGEPEPPQWHAVRIAGGDRTVWRGPSCAARAAEVLRFVEDLLDREDAALSDRYTPLG